MKISPIHLALLFLLLIGACADRKSYISSRKLEYNSSKLIPKRTSLSEEQLRGWPFSDILQDSVPGISLQKAVTFLTGKRGKPVTIAVIDSGIDTHHPLLKHSMWLNSGEIKDNGKDDDENGYIDDQHGWNFLGLMYAAQLEITRFIQKFAPR